MLENIQIDDIVRDNKTYLNNGLGMTVGDANDLQVKVGYLDKDNAYVEKWIDRADVILVNKPEGGFRNEGDIG